MALSINSISTNLAATHQIQQTQASLANTLTQLSTGSKINSAKDDPAGLIAQELMRADITATNAAIKSTQLSNAMLKVAESGMSQIGSLLNDAKGLAVEAANTGAMSSDMVQANQAQMNAILDSIDRIAGMTNWLGTSLLDGSFTSQTLQLGTDVVSSQQEQLSIGSARTTGVGNTEGSLADLRSGGTASLATNAALADSIIGASISQIATQRGEIGTTQKYTLDMNVDALQNSLVQLTAAHSLISDTDFAEAASNLMRDQILLQAGINALGIANENRSYAVSLIG